MLTFEQIKELVELVSQRQLGGLELERSGFRLKIDGQAPVRPAAAEVPSGPGWAPPGLSAPPAGSGLAHAAGGAAPAAPPGPAPAAQPQGHVLTSPLVGTFYRAPSPDSPSFVEVGSRVKKGQVVCIIEAMKLMNEIEADADGVIAEVYPQNAQAVEFGEPLFVIAQS